MVPVAVSQPRIPRVTTGMVAAALRRVSLPGSELSVEPPNGRTLVNFKTNFFTSREDFTRTVTLLGRQVDLRISAARFDWTFGDGESMSTTGPGAPYPNLDVTHEYASRGEVAASVDTTYVADFRVGGGTWGPVPGSVTVAGEPVAIDVVTATPVLVG